MAARAGSKSSAFPSFFLRLQPSALFLRARNGAICLFFSAIQPFAPEIVLFLGRVVARTKGQEGKGPCIARTLFPERKYGRRRN